MTKEEKEKIVIDIMSSLLDRIKTKLCLKHKKKEVVDFSIYDLQIETVPTVSSERDTISLKINIYSKTAEVIHDCIYHILTSLSSEGRNITIEYSTRFITGLAFINLSYSDGSSIINAKCISDLLEDKDTQLLRKMEEMETKATRMMENSLFLLKHIENKTKTLKKLKGVKSHGKS